MKKIAYLSAIAVFTLTVLSGCSKGYKEGVYTGTAIDNYGDKTNTATATVTIDSKGKVTNVYLDTTYTKDGKETTKKKLGKDYGMLNHPYGSKVGEWFEQVEKLEKKVIEDQGINKVKPNDEGKTDAVSGCTIKIDALYKALENAFNQAK